MLFLSSVDHGTNVYVLLSINWPKFGCSKLFVYLINVVMLPHSVTPFLKMLVDVCGLGGGDAFCVFDNCCNVTPFCYPILKIAIQCLRLWGRGGWGWEGGGRVLKDKVYLH